MVCEVEGANNLEYDDDKCFDYDLLSTECQADLCPEEAVCGMGTKKETMTAVKCPAGFYCTRGTRTNGTQVIGYSVDMSLGVVNTINTDVSWYKCPERYFCDEGTTFSTKQECKVGNYCPEGSAQYCCSPVCQGNSPDNWEEACDPVSRQSLSLKEDLTALRIKYPFTMELPLPNNLGRKCKSGTSSMRKAGSEDDCFVDWSSIDSNGPALYLFPFLHDDRFMNKGTKTHPTTRANSSWGPSIAQCGNTENTVAASYYNVEDLPRIAVPATSVARFTFNFTGIPKRLAYDDFFRISIFIDSGPSGRLTSRIILPERFFGMVDDNKAKMFTAGISSTEDIPAELPTIHVEQQSSSYMTSHQYQIFRVTLTNSPDRELNGTFSFKVDGVRVSTHAHATADVMRDAIIKTLRHRDASTVSNVTVTRDPIRRLDNHAGYVWTLFVQNLTKNFIVEAMEKKEEEGGTAGLSKERVFTFDVLVRKAVGMRVALEILHENIPTNYVECRNYGKYLLGSRSSPVAKIEVQRPSRFQFGEPVQTGMVISRAASEFMHLPANLPMNNSQCLCTNFSSSGCASKALRKDCELPPHGTEMDLVMPEWGRLDSDPLRPTLASHEKSVYWAFSEFSVEKVKLNLDIGRTMELLKKEVTVQLRSRFRSPLNSLSTFSNSDKRLYFERHSNYIPMPYFPFFSNCKGFSTRIPSFQLFENKQCDLVDPGNTIPVEAKSPSFFDPNLDGSSDSCDLSLTCIYDEVNEDVASPYTARIQDSREKYWFELTQDDPVAPFYMTFDAMSSTQMMDLQPRPSENILQYWERRKELVPVKTYRNRKYYGLSQQYAPKNVTMTVSYWQETKRRKHIVKARLEYDNFWRPDFCGGTNENQFYPDCPCGIQEYDFNSTEAKSNKYRLQCTRFEKRGYHLRVIYKPMSYIALFNSSVFPSYVYFAFFIAVAIITLFIIFSCLLVYKAKEIGQRCTEILPCIHTPPSVLERRDGIQLTLKTFLLRSQMPAAAAFILHAVPFFIVMGVVGALVHTNTLNLFWDFPGNLGDVIGKCFPPFSAVGGILCRAALKDDGTKLQWALTRLRFALGPLSLWYIRKGVRLICPAECELEGWRFNKWLNAPENKTRLQVAGKDMESKRAIAKEITQKKQELIPSGTDGKLPALDPTYKKRSHIWIFATIHVILLVFVVGWSRWKLLQQDQTILIVVFGLKMLKIPYEYWIRSVLREYWLMTSFLMTWSVMEFFVMLGSPTLMLFLVGFAGSTVIECFRRMFVDPCLLRHRETTMSGRRQKVHGRDAFNDVLKRHSTIREICCGFSFTEKELRTSQVRKWQHVTGKEGVLIDMVSSSVYLTNTMYAVFLLVCFYVLYDEMAVESLYGIHQTNLITYVWFVLVMLSIVVFTDYMTTSVTESRDTTRNRMKHLHRIAPNGYLWHRDLFSNELDLRIDDSLRSLDTLNFTMQYYYGCLLLSTGMILGYVFIYAYCSVADSSSSDTLLISLMSPFLDLITIVMFVVARSLLAFVVPKVEHAVMNALVDVRKEELGETQSLGTRMRHKYRAVCQTAINESWGKEQFIDTIKQATNEMIKLEIEKETGERLINEGLDMEAVKDVLFDEEDEIGGKKKLTNQIQVLMTMSSGVGKRVLAGLPKEKGVENPELFLLPPEADTAVRRGNWRTEVVREMYGL